MRCSKCGAENPDRANFCVECASPFVRRCSSCNAENPPAAKFCLECAKPLESSGGKPQRQSDSANAPVQTNASRVDPSLEGERKTVTVLSADIIGSTELEQDLDPEEARAIIDPALKLMIDAVHHYGGHVAQSTGDGIFAMFGAPIAHEDHPQRALHASLRIQNELKRYSGKVVAEGGIPMEVRIGATTGEVVARSIRTGEAHTEYAPVGHTANLASRMQAVAPTGSIAVSEMTKKLCEGYFSLRPLGPTSVKGVSEPVSVYEVTGLGPLRTRLQRAAGQGLTKFVGREREMEALKHAAEQARAGRGQIAVVVADPGIGKSRLFVEFKAKNQSGWMVLEAFSVSHGKTSAYLPVVDMLHSYFEIRPEDDARKKREKTTGKVLALDRSLEDTLPLLFGLLGVNDDRDPLVGMESGSRRRRTLDAIKRILLRESLNQPLMLIFEDLHWTDSETQGLLNLLADSIGNSKIVLLVSYRPEYSHQWANKTYYAQLRLDPLGRQSAEEMLDALLGSESEFTLKRFIIERAEGNPLFMEEIVHALFEEGALIRNGVTRATRPLSVLKVPPTVQGVLASRIDRLPMAQKELLQTLAAIGREFPVSLIRAVSQMSPEQLDQTLNNLQLAEFIYEQPAIDDVEYIFKHALTQQVAHESLLLERRKDLHEQIGNAIERIYSDSIDLHLAALANHYKQSRNVDKAVEFLQRAAEQASGRSAVVEAESLYHDAIGLLLAKPQSQERDLHEFDLQMGLGALLISRSFSTSEREQPLRRAHELSLQIGDLEKTYSVLFQLGQLFIMQGRLHEAKDLAEPAAKHLEDLADPILEACTLENLAECYWWPGELQKARPYFERTLAICETTSPGALIHRVGFDLGILTLSFLALTELLLGRPARSRELYERLIERAQSSAQPYSRFLGLWLEYWILQVRGDPRLLAQAPSSQTHGPEEYGLQEVSAGASQFEGWSAFWRGERSRGIAKMNEAIEKMGEVNSFNMLPWRLLSLGEMKAEVGDIPAAEALVAQALEKLKVSREGWYLPEVYRVAAKVDWGKSPETPNLAEKHLRHAIESARDQGTKLWEIRATTSLARLLCDTNRRDEARVMLADIYNWFTEGFDLPDLKDAKALLDELSVSS